VNTPVDPAMRQKCLPTYLVIDVSASMRPYENALNNTLQKLHTALIGSPRVSEFAHMSIIAFSTQPWLAIEMIDMELVPHMPRVMCDGATNYGPAFELVRQRLEVDLPMLNAQGKAVLRPCVFFLTDGEPTDTGWEAAFDWLVDPQWTRRPHVIAYGFGRASDAVLRRVGTKGAFAADGTAEPDEALSRAISSLLNTLVASARTEEMHVPTSAVGYRAIPIEIVE
jgi:uncharacterized protein YegL